MSPLGAETVLARAQTDGDELLGPDGLLGQVTKAVLERALAEEMTEYLGYDTHDPAGRGWATAANGVTGKRLLTEIGVSTWRCLVTVTAASARRSCARARPVWTGSTTASSLYARGLTTRDMRAHLREMYDVDVFPGSD